MMNIRAKDFTRVFLVLAVTILCQRLAAQTFYNNGQIISIKSGATVKSNGSLINQSGSLSIENLNNEFALLEVNGTFTNNDEINLSGVINLNGNWINNSSFTTNEGTVNLNGINQTIGGSSETTFFNLDLINAGIKDLDNSIHINGVLDLGDSELSTGSNKLYINNSEINALTFSSGFVSSDEDGFLQRSMLFAGQYIFPVGENFDNPTIRKLVISPSFAEISIFNCRFVNENPNNNGLYSSLLQDSLEFINENWYHLLNRIEGSNPIKLEIYYLDSDGEFNTIANWKTAPSPMWYYNESSYKNQDNSHNIMTINAINDFGYPAFALSYKSIKEIDTIPELPELLIYNSFSPNGDNFNDMWVVENCTNCNVKIFNRNGNLVFVSTDNSVSWDGKFNEMKVPDATYYYIISHPSDTKLYKGSVTIIR